MGAGGTGSRCGRAGSRCRPGGAPLPGSRCGSGAGAWPGSRCGWGECPRRARGGRRDPGRATPRIAVDEGDVLPGALRIVRQLRPAWEPAAVKTKLFTDGITNKLVACYTDEGMADAVLVRVYGRKTELLVDRETELRNFQVLRAHGCAPDLYCAFQNGLCYQFLPGIALGPDHVRDPCIFRLVAREMARVHAIHANGSLPRPMLWQKLHKYLTLVKTELSPKVSNPSPQALEQELLWMKETLPPLGSPVVLCHNDLLCKNIIYDRTRERVRFIDYEYTGYNYQAFDIGNHFNEFAGEGLGSAPGTQRWPQPWNGDIPIPGMEEGVLSSVLGWEMWGLHIPGDGGGSFILSPHPWDGGGSQIPSPIMGNGVFLLLGMEEAILVPVP
uniref:ethanolamine kinase n=1 Tax=Malurus cyaneus samueli TaxID=2593467 RepID=A0A8C5U7S7_9PASS